MKKAVCFLLIVSMSLLLCGCWNNFDIDSLAVVVGIGFDKGSNGKIQVTAEVLNQNAGQSGKGGGSSVDTGQGRGSLVYTEEGRTLFEAIRNFIGKTGERPYWNDVQVIVIGEAYAKDGMEDILDYFERDQQATLKSNIVVAKGMTAREVLAAQPDSAQMASTQINNALVETTSFGKNAKTSVFDVFRQLSLLHPCAVVGAVEMDSENAAANQEDTGGSSGTSDGGSGSGGNRQFSSMAVQGSAVLKGHRLLGYFTPEATRGYNFAENKIKGVVIVIPNTAAPGKLVSIKLISALGKMKAEMDGGRPKLAIEVKARGAVGDQQGGGNPAEAGNLNALTKSAQEEIKSEIREAVNVSQQTFHADALGFSERIYENSASEWDKIKADWDRVYSGSEIDVQVTVLLERTGMITKPLS